MSAIRRDFLPSDLEKDIREAGIDGVVSVQARQTREETHWLLDTVAQNDKAPLTEPSVRDELDLLRGDPRFRAIRQVVQGEPDGYLVRSYSTPACPSCRKWAHLRTYSSRNVNCPK